MSVRRAIARVGDAVAREVDAGAIDQLLADQRARLWLDIEEPRAEDIELLKEEFGFHELALEDALLRGQRPKVDEYSDYYFIVLYAASTSPRKVIGTHEVHCFWGPNYVVTLHEEAIPEIQTAMSRWSRNPAHLDLGVAYQVYALFDALIDGYYPAVDALVDRIEELEEAIFQAGAGIVEELFSLRKQLLDARRVLGPSRDVLNVLIRRDVPIFPAELVPYLADVYDHSIHVIDALDVSRELVGTATDSYVSVASHRLNQTMRTLTALTIGLMVPTLIAGVYGMNFHSMPELTWALGYPMALALMAGAMGLLFLLFRRVGWLGSSERGWPSHQDRRERR